MNNELKNYLQSDELKNKRLNKMLIERFPWLTPRNVWSGKKITDCMGEDGEKGYWPGDPESHPKYEYTYTAADYIPTGWRKAFGWELLTAIDEALTDDIRDQFYFMDIKEKWGELRMYPSRYNAAVQNIVRSYEAKSRGYCICCGAPATKETTDWVSPYCDECYERVTNNG